MLLKRAYTKLEFEELISQTKFSGAEIQESLTALEILLTKGESTLRPPYGSLAPAPALCYTSE